METNHALTKERSTPSAPHEFTSAMLDFDDLDKSPSPDGGERAVAAEAAEVQ